MMDYYDNLTEELASYLSHMAINLPDDVYARLKEMQNNETNESSKEVYKSMFKNLDLAKALGRPMCQDTGIIELFVKVGSNFKHIEKLQSSLIKAVQLASERTPFRPNAVLPFVEKNTGNNIGPGSPIINWEFVEGSNELEICPYFAGGGSSLPGFAVVLFPSEGLEVAKKRIVDMLIDRGVNACPPLMVGIGLGTCADSVGLLSKKALLRKVGSRNPDKNVAAFEDEMFKKLNDVHIGPNGFGGNESVISVSCEAECHHPATFAVGVSFGCWVTRRGQFKVSNDGVISSCTHSSWKGGKL